MWTTFCRTKLFYVSPPLLQQRRPNKQQASYIKWRKEVNIALLSRRYITIKISLLNHNLCSFDADQYSFTGQLHKRVGPCYLNTICT